MCSTWVHNEGALILTSGYKICIRPIIVFWFFLEMHTYYTYMKHENPYVNLQQGH